MTKAVVRGHVRKQTITCRGQVVEDGLSGGRRIAALAEANHAGVVPHNPLSAVSTAACLQIAATASNFMLQEFPNDTWDVTDKRPDSDGFLVGAARHDGEGFLTIGDEPGIGISLRPNAAEKFPYRPRTIHTRLHKDGSIADQ